MLPQYARSEMVRHSQRVTQIWMRSSPGRREQGQKPERISNCIGVGFALVAAEDSPIMLGRLQNRALGRLLTVVL